MPQAIWTNDFQVSVCYAF